MNIQPIVEGHGEVGALPVLLRRLLDQASAWEVEINRPIRRKRSELVNQLKLERTVQAARYAPDCDAILILFDSDKDCPAELGPRVHEWAPSVCGELPCEVVMPHKEYEAWFLAGMECLRGCRGIRNDATAHPNPEVPRGAKAQLQAQMEKEESYLETTDQAAFSALFSMSAAYSGCRSFRKLTKSFGALLQAMGKDVGAWPPAHWLEGLRKCPDPPIGPSRPL